MTADAVQLIRAALFAEPSTIAAAQTAAFAAAAVHVPLPSTFCHLLGGAFRKRLPGTRLY
jgi:hypothetical protein